MSVAVDVRDLFRIYSTPEGDAAALQGLSMTVRDQEVVVVLGPSGSGKTTFLRILAGLDRPSAGAARVFGADLARLTGRRLVAYRRKSLGYVDQHYARALAPELSARRLVAFPLGLLGVPTRARLARADELLERVGLEHRRHARPAELSGGEQQRVAVCAALAHGPRLLLADEPTGELDRGNAALVYELIGELAREHGCTTVIVSHDPESAAIADRVITVRDGRVSEEAARTAAGEEAIVVGRGGWLRLPEELLRRAAIRERATAHFADPGVVVLPAGEVEQPPEPVPRPTVPEPEPKANGVAAEVRALRKVYGSGPAATEVFAGLDASFARGRLAAVTGPSGSGKTTLLHLLAGLERPTGGEVAVLGRVLAPLSRTELAAFRCEHVALVGQDPGLVSFLSARENVELTLALRRRPAAEARRGALEALAAVGLGERSEQRVSGLSAGERERVAIARALAAEPALLLADEPTSRLDQANALAIGALLARLARESGAAVVCASHDPLLLEQADEELALAVSRPGRFLVPLARAE
jgi:ABC-type lipoprotein export system ATPase subunit